MRAPANRAHLDDLGSRRTEALRLRAEACDKVHKAIVAKGDIVSTLNETRAEVAEMSHDT